jgi:hypothetical protein
MKNSIKVIGIILFVAALAFTSCSEKGGTIAITNEYKYALVGTPAGVPMLVLIVEGTEFADAVKNIAEKGDTIGFGETKTYTFEENGIYTVVYQSFPPTLDFALPKTKPVTLLAGNIETITIK